MPLPLTSNAVPARIEAPWHRRLLASATVAAVTLLTLAGCSGPDPLSELEPEPGQLDYDVAVTRAAFQYGVPGPGFIWNPWASHAVNQKKDNAIEPLEESHFEAGMERMCSTFDQDRDEVLLYQSFLGSIGDEAIRGAVASQASPEFRDAASALFDADATSDYDPAEVMRAQEVLSTDFYDEWVELYDLQESLSEEAYSIEGAQAVQAALAESCGVDLDEADVVDTPMYPMNHKLFRVPPYQLPD